MDSLKYHCTFIMFTETQTESAAGNRTPTDKTGELSVKSQFSQMCHILEFLINIGSSCLLSTGMCLLHFYQLQEDYFSV